MGASKRPKLDAVSKEKEGKRQRLLTTVRCKMTGSGMDGDAEEEADRSRRSSCSGSKQVSQVHLLPV
jgi:hypothetical protein